LITFGKDLHALTGLVQQGVLDPLSDSDFVDLALLFMDIRDACIPGLGNQVKRGSSNRMTPVKVSLSGST